MRILLFLALFAGLCFANVSLPPGMDFFGMQVDESSFRHAYSPRNCSFGPSLFKWLKDYDATVDGIEVKSYKIKGCGVSATRPLPPKTTVVKYSARIALTRQSATAADLDAGFDDLSPVEQLILFAIREKKRGKRSTWKPYMDTTPSVNQMTNSLFWTESEMNMLEGSHVSSLTKQTMKEIDSMHKSAIEKFPTLKRINVTLADMMWGWGLVNSRQITFNDKALMAVPPLIDLVNCGAKPNVRVESTFERGQTFLHLITTREVLKGEELILPLPPQDNAFLSLKMGMSTANLTGFDDKLTFLPAHFAEFVWGRDHQESEVRKEFYKYLKLDKQGREWFYSATTGPSFDLINAARARSINVKDVSDASAVLPRKKMFSLRNELEALQKIHNITLEKQKLFVSSIDEDKALLKNVGLAPRERIAIQVRLWEKIIMGKVLPRIEADIADVQEAIDNGGNKNSKKKPAKQDL